MRSGRGLGVVLDGEAEQAGVVTVAIALMEALPLRSMPWLLITFAIAWIVAMVALAWGHVTAPLEVVQIAAAALLGPLGRSRTDHGADRETADDTGGDRTASVAGVSRLGHRSGNRDGGRRSNDQGLAHDGMDPL